MSRKGPATPIPAPRGRKPKRQCACGKTIVGLFPQCDACRQAACPHTDTHFDSNLAQVCACGLILKDGTRKKVGKGAKPIVLRAGEVCMQTL